MNPRHLSIVSILMLILLLFTSCNSSQVSSTSAGSDSNKTNAGSSNEKIELDIGHVAPESHSYHLGLLEFKKAIEERTNGRVQINIFPNTQLGGDREMIEQVMYGSLDMALPTAGVIGNFNENIALLELPYLFRDLDHVYKVLDGEIGQELLDGLSDAGIKGIAFWEKGFMQLVNNKRKIYTPEDMRGLKMRSIENDVYVQTYKSLEADPTPIAQQEVFTSIQQGIVDGWDNTIGANESTKMYQITDYMSLVNLYYSLPALIINQDIFNNLPDDIQEILLTTGKEFATVQREINQNQEKEQLAKMKGEGLEVIETSEIDIEAFREATHVVHEKYWGKWGDYIHRISNVK